MRCLGVYGKLKGNGYPRRHLSVSGIPKSVQNAFLMHRMFVGYGHCPFTRYAPFTEYAFLNDAPAAAGDFSGIGEASDGATVGLTLQQLLP